MRPISSMPCLSFILPLLRALHVAYSSRLFLAERDPVASLGLALSALPRRPCTYSFRLIPIPLSKIHGWNCFRDPCRLFSLQAISTFPHPLCLPCGALLGMFAIFRAALLCSRTCTLTRPALLLPSKASFAFVKGSVSYFPACVKRFFAIAKNFFGKLSRLAFVLFGKGAARRGRSLENSLNLSSNCWVLPRPRRRRPAARGARGERPPRPNDR